MEAPPKVKCFLSASTLCSHVDCRNCKYFKAKYGEVAWVCSFCPLPENVQVLGYYGDGPCSNCGEPRIVNTAVLYVDVR